MATSNIKKKLAALSELRKDPVAAIGAAWTAIYKHVCDTQGCEHVAANEHDVDLIEQIVLAVVEDAKAERSPKPKASDA